MNQIQEKTHELVKSAEQLATFNQIWKAIWDKKFNETDEFKGEAVRFLIHGNKQQPVGTIEFVPYKPDLSSYERMIQTTVIEDVFSFHKFSLIQQLVREQAVLYEVDKLCILPEHRSRKHLLTAIRLIVNYARQQEIDYYVALINPHLFDLLTQRFFIPCDTFTEGPITINNYQIMPVLLHAK